MARVKLKRETARHSQDSRLLYELPYERRQEAQDGDLRPGPVAPVITGNGSPRGLTRFERLDVRDNV
jgi:hypothetical protein